MIFFNENEFGEEIRKIIKSYKINDLTYSITYEGKKQSYFALLFAIFISHLTSNFDILFRDKERVKEQILSNLEKYSKDKSIFEKPYLQLLTLTLSALYIIDGEKINFQEEFIKNIKDNKIKILEYLNNFKCLEGKASSGNYAMFLAIILIYLNNHLGIDKKKEINQWTNLHLTNTNDFGLWGKNKNIYSNFQNGYHQYEILKYLNLQELPINKASRAVENLINNYGGFAPYPGGGACYDYDAIFFLTFNQSNENFLKKNIQHIFNNFEINYVKGLGFAENIFCRPLNLKRICMLFSHPLKSINQTTFEKMISSLSIVRNKNKMINNHWSEVPYYWQKPNLFATWFRMMSIAKLDLYFNSNKKWNFINFPGIGY